MKRARPSKSAENVSSSTKDEPPKKVAKKRVKSVSQSHGTPAAESSSVSSTPAPTPAPLVKPGIPFISTSKLGSLPMYGEHLPEDGYSSIPVLAEETCDNLRAAMSKIRESKLKGGSKINEIELFKQKGLVNFITLKKLNRLSHMYCKDTREQTHEQKLGVDDLHLQLQNLMYEAMHLRKEITNCLEFKSQHEEIDLISEEDLLLNLPFEDTIPTDDHQTMLKRLEWELQQRKVLAEQQNGLESDICTEEVEIKSIEEDLSNILPTLEGIRKATLPLQESLGIPLDKKREEQDMALLLPSSLYIFYMQAKAYSEIQDSSLAVSIVGDVGEARALQGSQQDNSDEESGDSDNEGGEKERRKKRRKQENSSVEKKISKAHPLAIVCTVTLKGSGSIFPDIGSFQITLSYLPHFTVVCAAVSSVTVVELSDEQLLTHLDKASLLHCLLADGDTGRTSPNATVSFHIRRHGNEVFSSVVRTYGFPYKWVQNMCGISDDVELPCNTPNQQQVDLCAENVPLMVNRLKNRFRAQVYLLTQLVALSLDAHKLVLGETECVQSKCKLVKWKQVPSAEVQSSVGQFISHSICNHQERMNRFYQGTLLHERVSMKFVVSIGAGYPQTPPAFVIKVTGTEVQNLQIKNIESDVNVQFPKLAMEADKHGKYLLCRQLQRMQSCFDVYLDCLKSPNTSRILSNKIRGKGRLVMLEI